MERYNADVAPDGSSWLAIDEDQRRELVLRHHQGRIERTLHPKEYNRQLHATLHVIIENQLAAADPPITGQTVARLCADGLRRHVALHVVMEALLLTLTGGEVHTPEDWERRLKALNAGRWLGEKMRKDFGAPS